MRNLPNYTHSIHEVGAQRVVALVDARDGLTITNAAEDVIADLRRRELLLTGDRVIYCDSDGRWDELCVDASGFVGFRLLGVYSLEAALERLAT
jgi:hypothetical protein